MYLLYTLNCRKQISNWTTIVIALVCIPPKNREPDPFSVYFTEITRNPRDERVRICLKKTSAAPETGARKMRGDLIVFGPASKIVHSLVPIESTITL